MAVNPVNRFPFRLGRILGSGGFAKVYEGFHHGRKRAFKMIALKEEEHRYDVKSYGCKEFYLQENDFEKFYIYQAIFRIKVTRSKLTRDGLIQSTHRLHTILLRK